MSIRRRSVLWKLAALCIAMASQIASTAYAAWRESDQTINSRGNVTVSVLVARAVNPANDEKANKNNDKGNAKATDNVADPAPTDIAVFFPGAAGKVRAAAAGISAHRSNPSTMGLLAEKFGMAVAIGLPSDQPDGLSIAWRLGNPHVGDAGAVIDDLAKRYPAARITLIGMSNGGRSVTNVAAAIARRGTPAIKAVVVMSAAPEALADEIMQPIRAAKVPVLVIHHERDSCLLFRDIEAIGKRYDFIAIDDHKQPRVDAFTRDCNPRSAHVFGGKEEMVYSMIADWVKTGALPVTKEATK
jgi:dienelactone hydrolase